jgi:tetratricopeptide (TPR) repeat protein
MEDSNESLDDAFKSADFSDKVWMFFSKYARPIASAMAVICLIVCLALIIMIGRSMCKKSMKMAYWEAIRTDTRERFAQKYISNPLGGTVFLELGDEAYQKKEYQRAADYYHHARVSLGGNILGGRAAIGEGIALIKSGLRADGEGILMGIRDEQSYPTSIRGQGAYLLASSLYGCGEFDKAKNTLNQLINGNFSDPWKMEGKVLLREIEAAQ